MLTCSASPSPPEPTVPNVSPEPADVVSVEQDPSAPPDNLASDTTPPPPEPVEDPGPSACPEGTKLVEGDYCTEVEQKCLVEWFAPQNQKRVCEQFETSTKCVGSRVPKRFCIDTYSWPNQTGVRPEMMNNFYQAQVKCAAVGKRMCTESEWTLACEGPEMKPFPYGYTRDPRKCNSDHQ